MGNPHVGKGLFFFFPIAHYGHSVSYRCMIWVNTVNIKLDNQRMSSNLNLTSKAFMKIAYLKPKLFILQKLLI